MASTVQVLCPNGRRQNVKVTPNTKLMQVGFCWTVIMGLVSGATNFVSLLLIEGCGCKVHGLGRIAESFLVSVSLPFVLFNG